jgi:hypothetical protein
MIVYLTMGACIYHTYWTDYVTPLLRTLIDFFDAHAGLTYPKVTTSEQLGKMLAFLNKINTNLAPVDEHCCFLVCRQYEYTWM